MAAVSNDGSGIRQATCTASRTGATYVETCGVAGSTVAAPVLPPPKPQTAPTNVGVTARSSVRLSWQDNANNETGFVIERCDQIIGDLGKPKPAVSCRGNWQTVGSVAANITTYVDNTVTANQTYMYRVKAVNPSGSSAYTPEAVITAPLK